VSDAPEGADHARAIERPIAADERRDGGHVVGVERMAEAEEEPDAESRDQ
jgi:hypothetical protein